MKKAHASKAEENKSLQSGSSRQNLFIVVGTALLAILLLCAVALGALGSGGQPHPDSRTQAAAERVPPPAERVAQRDDRAKPLPRQSSPRPSTARRLQQFHASKVDKHSSCVSWADQGECEKNPGFMQSDCAATCGKRPQVSYVPAPRLCI